jgi:hypothetical protein
VSALGFFAEERKITVRVEEMNCRKQILKHSAIIGSG